MTCWVCQLNIAVGDRFTLIQTKEYSTICEQCRCPWRIHAEVVYTGKYDGNHVYVPTGTIRCPNCRLIAESLVVKCQDDQGGDGLAQELFNCVGKNTEDAVGDTFVGTEQGTD